MNRFWKGVLILFSWLVLYGLAYSNGTLEIASQPDIEQGRDIYRKHCQECHGAEGRGDGPRAAMLAPPNRKFSVNRHLRQNGRRTSRYSFTGGATNRHAWLERSVVEL